MPTIAWIGLALLLVLAVIVILCNTPSAKAARQQRREREQREAEERERIKAENERVAEQKRKERMENLRKRQFVVYFRGKDGKKNSFESAMISALVGCDVSVRPIGEDDGRAISNGEVASLKEELALVGTSWTKVAEVGGYEDMYAGWIPRRNVTYSYCDYRLIGANEGAGKILGAGCSAPDDGYADPARLAGIVVQKIASILTP